MKLFMAASLAPAHTEYAQKVAHISYTMCAHDLINIYTLSPRALGVYISQNPLHTWYNYYMYM